jgi:hypothetical protein
VNGWFALLGKFHNTMGYSLAFSITELESKDAKPKALQFEPFDQERHQK